MARNRRCNRKANGELFTHSVLSLDIAGRRCARRCMIPMKWGAQMATVNPFHSVNEKNKDPRDRVYHNKSTCPSGRDIPKNEREPGRGGYRLCRRCPHFS